MNPVPEARPTIAVADATGLVKAPAAYSTLDRLATWLPWIAPALVVFLGALQLLDQPADPQTGPG